MLKKGDNVKRNLAVGVRVGTVKYDGSIAFGSEEWCIVNWSDGSTSRGPARYYTKITEEEFVALLIRGKDV